QADRLRVLHLQHAHPGARAERRAVGRVVPAPRRALSQQPRTVPGPAWHGRGRGPSALRRDAMTTKTDRITVEQIHAMGERTSNWGRWGPDDELGTLNHVTAQDIITAAGLIKKGKGFSLGLHFDLHGPQEKSWGNRFNPIHVMLQTGTDAVAGRQDGPVGLRYADDIVSLPLQCGTQWDALSHIFMGEKMWNGYDARLVDSTGAAKKGIEKVKDRMVGRGVLLDVARF